MEEGDRRHMSKTLDLVKEDRDNWYSSYRIYVGMT